ncbi:MAG TPA: hypothetical protein VGC40_14290 [Paenirhodobacter sp.]
MTRHLLDRTTPQTEGARLKHFIELARREGIHPAIHELGQRPVLGRSARKVQEFLRIERQENPAT